MSTKVTLLLGNDTIQVLHEGPPSPFLPCGLLLFLLVLGLLLNAFLLLAILFSALRSTFYNAVLAFLSGANLFEVLVNITSSVVIRASWEELYEYYGFDFLHGLCKANASTVQFSNVIQCYVIAILSIDRSIVMGASNKQYAGTGKADKDESVKQSRILARVTPITMVFCLAAVLPPLAGLVNVRLYYRRYGCNLAYASQGLAAIISSVLLLLLGFHLPWFLVLRSWVSIGSRVYSERVRLHRLELVARQRAAERRSPVRGVGSTLGLSNTSLWTQVWGLHNDTTAEGYRYFALVLGLTLLHFLLVAPNIISMHVMQFRSHYNTERDDDFMFSKSMFNMSKLPDELLAVKTSAFDSLTTWARFLFFVIAPLLTICTHQGVKSQFTGIVCCCFSSHSTLGQSQVRSVSALVQALKEKEFRKKHDYHKKRNSLKYKKVADLKTPVLFATSEGLHLRTFVTDNFLDTKQSDSRMVINSSLTTEYRTQSWSTDPRFVCEFCDLIVMTTTKDVPPPRRPLPKLSQTPPMTRSVDRALHVEEDLDLSMSRERKGKIVRFAQGVSEIPLSESGIYSSEDPPTPSESAVTRVQPSKSLTDTFTLSSMKRPLQNRVSFDRLREKRHSDTLIMFPKAKEGKNAHKNRAKSLELDLIQNGNLNSSTSSLILTLSQRMRNRPS